MSAARPRKASKLLKRWLGAICIRENRFDQRSVHGEKVVDSRCEVLAIRGGRRQRQGNVAAPAEIVTSVDHLEMKHRFQLYLGRLHSFICVVGTIGFQNRVRIERKTDQGADAGRLERRGMPTRYG